MANKVPDCNSTNILVEIVTGDAIEFHIIKENSVILAIDVSLSTLNILLP